MAKQKIGFLGTGIMGYQMARRLCEAGYPVTAWNRTRSKAEPLAEFGATIAEAPAAATAGVGGHGVEALAGGLPWTPSRRWILVGLGVAIACGERG